MALTKYNGPWTLETAKHLLNRSTLGYSYADLKKALEDGMDASIEQLFMQINVEPPINYYDTADENVAIGETWVNQPANGMNTTRTARTRSLYGWQMKEVYSNPMSISHRLLMFWHNHFPIERLVVNDPRFLYNYWETLRKNSWGNFKDLVKEITISPAMLRYLDGRSNTKNAPNENYARELLELFTIGKGPQIGPGDYTNYTEDDIVAISKILTGWLDYGYNSQTIAEVYSAFVNNRHDQTTKELSEHFDFAVIENQLDSEYASLIDIIFQQDEVARFISRKLYRFFVATEINDEVENTVISDMAALILDDDYNIESCIRTLLSSDYFYNLPDVRGGIISNPIEFAMRILNGIGTTANDFPVEIQYEYWRKVTQQTGLMQMLYFAPPDVAGWPSYYLEPQYSELWMNSVTVKNRVSATNIFTRTNGFVIGDQQVNIDLLAYVSSLDSPLDVNLMIKEIGDHLTVNGFVESQRDALKEILLPGLPDNVWTEEWAEYLGDPDNESLKNQLRNRLKDILDIIITIPEFQTI